MELVLATIGHSPDGLETQEWLQFPKRQKTIWRDKTSIRTGHHRDAGMISPRI